MNRSLCVFSLALVMFGCAETPSIKSDDFVVLDTLKYAEGFEISQNEKGDYRIDLFDLESDDRPVNYSFYLVEDTTGCELNDAPVLAFPLNSLACLSTTHIALLAEAEALESLSGVAFRPYIKNEEVLHRLHDGRIKDLSGAEDVDLEKLLDLQPQAFLVYPFGQADYTSYEDLDIPCIPFSEYLEKDPLARSEWMILAGLMCGSLEASQNAFGQIEERYLSYLEMGQNVSEKPSVFTGSYSQGVWFAPSGNSLISKYISDASGSYLFANEHSARNLEFQFEELFDRAYEVDFWGKIVYEESELTMSMIQEQDERYTELKAFRDSSIFYCNALKDDYFGAGIVEPDRILADLLAIFHPNLLPDHQPAYFRMITK